jgi:hypothetical protein
MKYLLIINDKLKPPLKAYEHDARALYGIEMERLQESGPIYYFFKTLK